MIDIDKLRQALGAVQPEEVEKLLDRLEAAEKERDDAKAAAENIAWKLDYLRSKLETAENAQNDWLRANAPGGWIDNLRIENEALRAEIIHIKEVEFPRKAQAVADGWRGKCERLEAKIAEMEKQEPVAWAATDETKTVVEALGMNQSRRFDSPLFLAPGAQPAPSVPDATWLPMPDKHPTFHRVDLHLADGSVLCGCLPQSDGDYWWEGPSGEVFIDPRYAPVTHWRLSATPEDKP